MLCVHRNVNPMGSRLDSIGVNRSKPVSVLLLVALTLCQLPLPYSATSKPDKDRSRPFPCQDRPCGCRSAEQCWQRCCCFTREQKLAWVQRHAVRVPELARRKPCCLHQAAFKQPPTSCSRVMEPSSAPPRKSCCQPLLVRSGHCPEGTLGRKDDRPKREGGEILALVAHSCQGQPWVSNTFAWQAVPVDSDSVYPVSGPPQVSLSITSDLLLARTLEPPVPPPRLRSSGMGQV